MLRCVWLTFLGDPRMHVLKSAIFVSRLRIESPPYNFTDQISQNANVFH